MDFNQPCLCRNIWRLASVQREAYCMLNATLKGDLLDLSNIIRYRTSSSYQKKHWVWIALKLKNVYDFILCWMMNFRVY